MIMYLKIALVLFSDNIYITALLNKPLKLTGMKMFVCMLAFATAFMQVQKRIQPVVEQSEDGDEISLGEEMLQEFCKN